MGLVQSLTPTMDVSPMSQISPSRPFPFLLFLPPLPSPHPLSPSPHPQSVFVPSFCCPDSIVSLLVGFALLPVLLCALALLPARVGFRVLSPPLPPPISFPFLCSACLLSASPCLFSAFVVFPLFPVVGCGWLFLFPPSFLPPRLCVCVCACVCARVCVCVCVCVSCYNKQAVTGQLLTRAMQGDRAL